ncbi:MAG: hypothetical protein ABIK09_01955 [Pseudomonadota bacterium]
MRNLLPILARPAVRAVLVASLAGAFLCALAAGRTDRREPDEAAWLFSTVYARLYASGDVSSEAWQNTDAVDHPPVGKYVIGICAALGGPLRETTRDKDFWHRYDLDMLQRGPFLAEIWRRVDPDALQRARVGGALASAGAVGLVTWVGELLVPGAGVVAGIALALHPLIRAYGGAALADPWFLLFALSAIAALVVLLRSVSADRGVGGPWIAVGVLGLALGLVAGTKITGLALWLLPVLPIPWAWRRPVDRRRALLACAGSLLVASVVFIGTNPALWGDPLDVLVTMFQHRLERVELQQSLFEFDAIERPLARLWLGVVDPVGLYGPGNPSPFLGGSPTVALFTAPILFALAGLGGLVLVRERRRPVAGALLAGVLLLGLPAITGYYLRWPRYLLPTLPLWALLAAVGLVAGVRGLGGTGLPFRARLRWPTTWLVCILALVGLGMAAWHPPATIDTPQREAHHRSVRRDLEAHYGRVHAERLVARARVRITEGRLEEALEIARFAARLDPDNLSAQELLEELELPPDDPPGP